MSLLSSPRFALAAALLGAGLLAAPAAQAFTLQDEHNNATDQSFLYPDRGTSSSTGQPSQGFTSKDGVTTYREGNTFLQFGHRPSFQERFSTENLFDPMGKPPGVR